MGNDISLQETSFCPGIVISKKCHFVLEFQEMPFYPGIVISRKCHFVPELVSHFTPKCHFHHFQKVPFCSRKCHFVLNFQKMSELEISRKCHSVPELVISYLLNYLAVLFDFNVTIFSDLLGALLFQIE